MAGQRSAGAVVVSLTVLFSTSLMAAAARPTCPAFIGAAAANGRAMMGRQHRQQHAPAPTRVCAVKPEDLVVNIGGPNDDFSNEQELDYLEWLAKKYRRKGNYDMAREIQTQIETRQEYDVRAVTRLNEVFYQAFTKQDTGVMGNLWLKEPEVSCIHPGVAEVVVGYDRVMRVWKDILAPKRSWIRITPEDCHVVVRGNTAYAYCFERVVSDSAGQSNEQRLFATNVFVRRQGMWFIVHHHATLLKNANTEKQGQNQGNSQLMQQLQQSLAGLNGAKIINLGGIKGGAGGLNGGMGSLDDLAAQLGAIERQLGESKKPRVKMLKDGKYQLLSADDDDDDEDDEDEDGSVPRDKNLTRKTVRAIQQLYNEGRITIEQKRRLLNEIIQHANDDVPSMVEIAYELLLRSDDDEDYDGTATTTTTATTTSSSSSSSATPAVSSSSSRSRAKKGASKEEDVLDEFAEQCRLIVDDMLPNL